MPQSVSYEKLTTIVEDATKKRRGSFSMHASNHIISEENFSLAAIAQSRSPISKNIATYAPIIVVNNPSAGDTKKQE